jgi:hypothetical protein
MFEIEKSYINNVLFDETKSYVAGFSMKTFIENEKKNRERFHIGGKNQENHINDENTSISRFQDLVIPIGLDTHTNYHDNHNYGNKIYKTTSNSSSATVIDDELFEKLLGKVAKVQIHGSKSNTKNKTKKSKKYNNNYKTKKSTKV